MQTPTQVKTKIAVAMGDGIGPEIMKATLRILEAADAQIDVKPIEIGEKVYTSGHASGIAPTAWETIEDAKIILKAPITTPQGGGYKSLNVTLRKTLNLFANVRPNKAFHPYVPTHFPNLDVTIIRENEEDLYAGIEHHQTTDVVQCLKLISRPGSERIVRYAFDYARANGRKKVTCMAKDNIMKLTDGLFHQVFDEIAPEYPDIEADFMIIDIGSARLAATPEDYDVVVTSNLYGDIVSDIVAQVAGSVGLAGSANIGPKFAMFEAIHGSAPDIAGKGIANPSGLLQGAVMMLRHIGQGNSAARIEQAWLQTLEDGIHTGDVFTEGLSKRRVNTQEFAEAVIERLPAPSEVDLQKVQIDAIEVREYHRPKMKKQLLGSDIFIDWQSGDANEIGEALKALAGPALKLKMITNRGVKVYPNGHPDTFCTDHWRCRFISASPAEAGGLPYPEVAYADIMDLLNRLHAAGWETIKTENLYAFDGKRAFSLAQGE